MEHGLRQVDHRRDKDAKDLHTTTSAVVQPSIKPEILGSAAFRQDYGLKYAYYSGAMYRGIASKELVIAMGKAGLMGFLGTGGLTPEVIEDDILSIQHALSDGQAYGMNLVSDIENPDNEMALVALYLKHGVRFVEAAAFIRITPALVYFRVKGLSRNADNQIVANNKIIAKVSRPEVAARFLSPPPQRIVQQLLNNGKITDEQAQMSQSIAMSDDICVEADSGGHTDQGIASVLLPSMQSLRDSKYAEFGYSNKPRVGLAGGIGTPNSAAAAFVMGADFIVSGSINQCTVEAGISKQVKQMLQDINVQDTDYAPAGDMFELGAKVQVLKKGVFFPARANKLFQLYQQYESLEQIPQKVQDQLQQKFFNQSFEQVWQQVKQYLQQTQRDAEIARAERGPKYKMARIFRWYFAYSMKLAFAGDEQHKVNFQVHTGPALGAFNQWVKGTELEPWQNRRVAQIGEKLMVETAELLNQRLKQLSNTSN